ncbi:MAG TPA: aspartate--tRNA ligase [Candidatus Angelobacter sp.]|jgi:aspartyl-tRNA synthetase|nr:aspartate--tRNA ligase [Candidatus Angelobacter sp.]
MTTVRTPCGQPRAADAGEHTVVYGWVDRRRDLGGLVFIDLRDRSGVVQCVFNPQTAPEAHAAVEKVRLEWVLRVEGELRPRAAENVNPKLATGDVELQVTQCTVLSAAKTPPFAVNEDVAVEESLRLRYRYLDLRRSKLQRNMIGRARFLQAVRRAMTDQGFLEIETPQMIRATPEGARDYLVPSRIFPGSFYALPQSPQLYKQLSMVAGFDRYFQIARCMRDEDLRADRQPEFTQLDVEMSFVDEEDVQAALETGIARAWAEAEFHGSVPTPFPRLTWREAMDRYGSDKPDTRFGLEIHDLTDVLRGTAFRVFAGAIGGGGVVRAIRVPGGADMTRGEIEGELTDVVKSQGAKGLAYVWLREEGWTSNVAKLLSPEELAEIGRITEAQVGDVVLMVADKHRVAAESLGALRSHLGRKRALYDEDQLNWLWVTEFPMFDEDRVTGAISPAHHPFTMVHSDDVDLLESDPLKVRSRAYDIVLNGREIGSGSIRITDPSIQERVFRAIGIDHDEAQRKFGFLLEAFQYGAPPHGGFAAGIDRLVMEGLREENIRDVIAFPKNQQAQELMTGAPSPVEEAQLGELGLQLLPQAPKKA